MINSRKLIKMARKWQKFAELGRKRISFPEKIDGAGTSDQSSEVAEKGHFTVYTADGVRFSFPIAYLSSPIFMELLRMSEEEFGHPSNGPITLPCDSQLLSYAASLMRNKAAKDVEKALLLSMADCKCSSSHYLHQRREQTSHHILLSCC
ncbi:auxin-responsive protein SAUR68-like [Salvia miltiorrhiza]|uniref:auxin-responsive protein SAUR68-like n=1 Tax=Salvia miltiorrhiza TaxID=226208 RepID=UPI0025ACE851|nr:auxin-responsive protein SAUR68-like [Salvia miltiorrhiza]